MCRERYYNGCWCIALGRTQNQRRQITKIKKYRQIMLNEKNEKNHTLVDSRNLREWEHKFKTAGSDRFKAFIKTKLFGELTSH